MAAKNIPASLERMLFLSQSDNHLHTFMPKKASLMPDLARRLLLEPGVVIPDSYFITSTDMANDLKKTGKSWVWHGLRKGVIVPAFREKEVDSFVENHQRGVKTTHPLGVRDDAHDLNVSLDAAFQGSNTRQLITWPDGMGIAFGKLVNSAFTRESDSISRWSPEDAGLWRKTRDLRAKYVEAAWKLQKDPDTEGLRRASIFRAMAADLGAGDANETPKLIASAPRRDRTALRATILWVDELYNYNHASRMQVRPYFPVGRAAGAHMMPKLMWQQLEPDPPPDQAKQGREHEVRWPSDKLILDASPDSLLGIRTDTKGADYLKALDAFHGDPSDVNWANFKVALDLYADAICNAVSAKADTVRKVRYDRVDAGIAAGGALGAAAVDAGFALAGLPPPFTTVSLVTATLVSTATLIRKSLTGSAMPSKMLPVKAARGSGDVRIDLPHWVGVPQ